MNILSINKVVFGFYNSKKIKYPLAIITIGGAKIWIPTKRKFLKKDLWDFIPP